MRNNFRGRRGHDVRQHVRGVRYASPKFKEIIGRSKRFTRILNRSLGEAAEASETRHHAARRIGSRARIRNGHLAYLGSRVRNIVG